MPAEALCRLLVLFPGSAGFALETLVPPPQTQLAKLLFPGSAGFALETEVHVVEENSPTLFSPALPGLLWKHLTNYNLVISDLFPGSAGFALETSRFGEPNCTLILTFSPALPGLLWKP